MRKILLLLFTFLLVMPLSPKANGEMENREQVFAFLKGGFEAQVALSEKLRSKQEILDILTPFFSERYQQEFWKANVVKEEHKYVTYGSDFAQYYIPFYQFSNETKVAFMKNKIYVFEYFPESSEGPVGYKSHYEGLLITRHHNEWKVDQYLYNNIPKSIIEKVNEPVKKKSYIFSFFKIKHIYS